MQIDGVHIKNFLPFDTFGWSGLDPHLNIIVGLNGSGKTNLLHVLRATGFAQKVPSAQNVDWQCTESLHLLYLDCPNPF